MGYVATCSPVVFSVLAGVNICLVHRSAKIIIVTLQVALQLIFALRLASVDPNATDYVK
jgi:hypothetical protein